MGLAGACFESGAAGGVEGEFWPLTPLPHARNRAPKNSDEPNRSLRIRNLLGSGSRQLENDMYDRRRIRRLAVSECRLESNLFRRMNGGIVQSVPQTTHYPQYPQLA